MPKCALREKQRFHNFGSLIETASDGMLIYDVWFKLKISTTMAWTAIKSCTDIDGPQIINPNDFGNPLTLFATMRLIWRSHDFPSSTIIRQNVYLSDTLVYICKLMIFPLASAAHCDNCQFAKYI